MQAILYYLISKEFFILVTQFKKKGKIYFKKILA